MRRTTLAASLLAALALGACSSTSERSRPDGTGRMASREELPAAQRAAWSAWQENGPAWEEGRAAWLAAPEVARFLVDNWILVMVRTYDRSGLARRGALPGPFERARQELLHARERSAPVLLELVAIADGVVARLAADLLVEMDDPALALAAAEKLDAEDPAGRQRAADLLARLPHALDAEPAVEEALARAALDDPEWTVRAQAARAMGLRAERGGRLERAREVLSRALGDEDPAVARAACEALGTLRDPRAVPALVNHLERRVRAGAGLAEVRTIEAALRAATGDPRSRTPQEWRAWWQEHRPR